MALLPKFRPIDELPVYEKASSFSPIDRQTDMDTQWVMGAVGKGIPWVTV